MPSDKVTVEFKDGKKITKHRDGRITEQSKEDLERFKTFLTNEKQRIDRHLSLIDTDIQQITASQKAK